MLVLSRKKGESIVIQDHIEITVLEVDADIVKIGVSAPKEITIYRKELHDAIKESNLESSRHPKNLLEMTRKLKDFN